jgi:hypothetical protein
VDLGHGVLNGERPRADLRSDVEELGGHAVPVVAVAPEAAERPTPALPVLLALLSRRGHLAEGEAGSPHPAAPLAEIVRIYGIRHWIEQSYKQVKDELG